MKKTIIFSVCAACVMMFTSCEEATEGDTTVTTEVATPDLAQIKTEIQAIETEWANAMNSKDVAGVMSLFAEDAMSMSDGQPTIVGKEAIQKSMETEFADPSNTDSVTFETLEVYAQGDYVTEIGKSTYIDAAGKPTKPGKYMAFFVKKDGKYLCIRDIYNKDYK